MKILALALSVLAGTSRYAVSGLEDSSIRAGRRTVSSNNKMMMGGTLADFLDSMVGFGDITQAQMDAILGFTNATSNGEDLEAIQHNSSDAASQNVTNVNLEEAYIQAQLDAGTISVATAEYLSSLLSVNEFSSAASASNTTTPAIADYTGNGNVAFLGKIDPASRKYNGIWGVALGGREYALTCSGNGLHIIDVTNPASPFQVQLIKMDGGNIWRDAGVHTDSNGITYAYVAAQGGSSSLFAIRLSALAGASAPGADSDPIPPADIANRGFLNLGHTMNVENGLLFINSANPGNGCRILDLEADPFDPPELSPYFGSGKDCHDSLQLNDVMVNGIPRNLLFSADGRSETFRIADITDIRSPGSTPVQIGQTAPVTGIYAHSLAVSEDKKTMYTFEEFDAYDIGIYDISNPASTVPQINTFAWSGDVSVGSAHVHNDHIRGKYLLVAYYEAGLRVFDVSNPLNPLEVGKYETWRDPDGDGIFQNGVTGSYKGTWNLYPHLPSGNVLVTDRNSRGLFIVRVDPVPFPSTPTNLGASGSTESSITITWDAASNASGYTVKRGTSSGIYGTTLATNVVGTSYTDDSLSGGDLYYVVSATNAEGESPDSANVGVFAPTASPVVPTPAPVAPTLAPVVPTSAPVVPTLAPVVPTSAPVVPTAAPVVPTTSAPVIPSLSPTGSASPVIAASDAPSSDNGTVAQAIWFLSDRQSNFIRDMYDGEVFDLAAAGLSQVAPILPDYSIVAGIRTFLVQVDGGGGPAGTVEPVVEVRLLLVS